MSEHLSFFEWFGRNLGAIVPAMLAIIGAAFLAARQFRDGIARQLIDIRTEVDDELKEYRHEIKNVWLVTNQHATFIVALQTEQRNTATQLTDIKAETRAINGKLDSLSREITDVLVLVKITTGGVK